MFLQGEARLVALQILKELLSGNLTSIGRMCSSLLCLSRCVNIRTRSNRLKIVFFCVVGLDIRQYVCALTP